MKRLDGASAAPNDASDARDREVALASEQTGGARRRPTGRAGKSRAVRLLEQLLEQQLATAESLSALLSLSPRQFRTYLSGRTRMPVDAQRRLAELIVTQVPELRREARRLQLQCDAETRFHAKETKTHMIAPPRRFS